MADILLNNGADKLRSLQTVILGDFSDTPDLMVSLAMKLTMNKIRNQKVFF